MRTRQFVGVAGARILLAGDNADMRAYCRDLLSANYVVEAVAQGEQALDAVRREQLDLIVANVMMPRLDGAGLCFIIGTKETVQAAPHPNRAQGVGRAA